MNHAGFDLAAAARQEMIDHGFQPDFPAGVAEQLAGINGRPDPSLRDLRSLLWSSIDNDDSRDLDQIEWAERTGGGIRVLVAIADVSASVAQATPIDAYAARETTTVYTGVRTFPMLPERLSTDLTSLAENQDRAAVVIDMTIASDGSIQTSSSYRAVVRNRAQLTYNGVGPWLENTAPAPPKVAASPDLQAQLKLQDEAAQQLCEARHRHGALSFDRLEIEPLVKDGQVQGLATRKHNRAGQLIEDFMIAANEAMARALREAGVASIRRVVKDPERWPRIVELARQYGEQLPAEPDSGALNQFLLRRRDSDPVHYADVSLAVLKLMGPGEYVVARPGDAPQGHFGLAAHDYTHSTAPNRRFADLVTQRLLKSLETKSKPYPDEDLDAIARHCTLMEDAARKVQRAMQKRLAAAALQDRAGETFSAVVTGVTPKGVFVRVPDPPIEGRLMRGERGLDVGDRLRVTLLSTDPQRGFIDFGR
ncbi:MAG TPA: RNB domain-containing ribonuclease [Bryobacteraceae bacterium]|nr:RNB domain-containing ribonuclease [Bryobacteraceae bacterium]